MGHLYYKEADFPKNNLDFGFSSVITIECLISINNLEVESIVKTLLTSGHNVILEDHAWSCTSVKELFPEVEVLTKYPKFYITIKFKSNPWPG